MLKYPVGNEGLRKLEFLQNNGWCVHLLFTESCFVHTGKILKLRVECILIFFIVFCSQQQFKWNQQTENITNYQPT